MSRFQGQHIGYIVGTEKDFHTVVYRLPHGELEKAPRIGDLARIEDRDTNRQWLARVEGETHVSIDLRENEIRDAIARGQYLETELDEHEKAMYLGHDFTIRVLGELTKENPPEFRPIVRNLPARGSRLYHLEPKSLKQLVTLDDEGPVVGYYAIGDEVHDRSPDDLPIRFDVKRFISRKTAIFGVTGFGKSNLMKVILAYLAVLTSEEPTVGKLVFDLEGEYAFSTEQGIGLADIPAVSENLVVFTNSARARDKEYLNVYAGPAKLNLQDIHPARAVSILFPEWRQKSVYVDLLRSTTMERWQEAIELVAEKKRATPIEELAEKLGLDAEKDEPSLDAMVRALDPLIRRVHEPASTLMIEVYQALQLGATVIVDLSQMRLASAFNTMSLIVDDLFEGNQEAFVGGAKVPEIVVFIEEAQNLLSQKQVNEDTPIVRLAKEGRKYNLGLTYVTQQPGAIAEEILSQTNNFFVMHLLSKGDIKALTDVNPHYGGVIRDFIQTESLLGHAYLYSSVPNMPIQSYVFGAKAVEFDKIGDHLQKPKGYRAYYQRRLEYIEAIAEKLEPLVTAPPDESDEEYDYFKWWEIAKKVGQQLPEDWPVYIPTMAGFLADSWTKAALEKLELPFEKQKRYDNTKGKEYWYLAFPKPKKKQVIHDEADVDVDEVPF
ncbi:MAG: ATP-binding protein [Anaerolineae bacterium]